MLAGIDALLDDIAAAQSNRSASASRSLLWMEMETSMDAASGAHVRATAISSSGSTALHRKSVPNMES